MAKPERRIRSYYEREKTIYNVDLIQCRSLGHQKSMLTPRPFLCAFIALQIHIRLMTMARLHLPRFDDEEKKCDFSAAAQIEFIGFFVDFNLSSLPSFSHSISSDIMFPLLRCFLSFIPWNWFAWIGSLIRWKFSIVINQENDWVSSEMDCVELERLDADRMGEVMSN